MRVNIISGDVTQTAEVVDAIATLVNSEGMWFGGIDRAIQGRCGSHYYSHLATQLGQLSDGQVYIVKGESHTNFSFKDIIFVIDDLTLSLKTLVFNTLCAAQETGYKRIAIPAMRTGIMAGIVEKTPIETVSAIKDGVTSFQERYPYSDLVLDIVVFQDKGLVEGYQRLLKQDC